MLLAKPNATLARGPRETLWGITGSHGTVSIYHFGRKDPNMSVKNKIAAVACGLALVGTVAAPVGALAATTASKSTEVTLTASDKQLDITVPTSVNFAVGPDGALVTPSAEALKITNNSAFTVHTTTLKAEAADGFNIVADTAKATETNAFAFSISTNGKTVKAAEALGDAGAAFVNTLGYKGSSTATLKPTVSGSLSNVTKDISQATKAATITWNFAVGAGE